MNFQAQNLLPEFLFSLHILFEAIDNISASSISAEVSYGIDFAIFEIKI